MTYQSLSDECLVKVILGGDTHAFAQLHERYSRFVYAVAYRIMRDTEDARDASQDIFVKLYRFLHLWDVRKSRLSTWIYRLASNHSIDCRRLRLRFREIRMPQEEAVKLCHPVHSSRSPFNVSKNREEIRRVLRCVKVLPDFQRKVFMRRYFQGLKLVEIAEIESCRLEKVKASLYRATNAVRRILLPPVPDC